MDWTEIIKTLLTLLIPTGGLVAIFTMAEKKSAMMLENAKALANSYKDLADEYKSREARTQEILEAKEEALVIQQKLNGSLRHELDDAHTAEAVARLMYCKKAKCIDRDPPFGCNADSVVENIKAATKREYQHNMHRDNGKSGRSGSAEDPAGA